MMFFLRFRTNKQVLQSGSRDRAEVFGLGVLECIDSNNKRTALSKNYLIIIKNKGEDFHDLGNLSFLDFYAISS